MVQSHRLQTYPHCPSIAVPFYPQDFLAFAFPPPCMPRMRARARTRGARRGVDVVAIAAPGGGAAVVARALAGEYGDEPQCSSQRWRRGGRSGHSCPIRAERP